MRILILTPQLPWPLHQGTALRNYHIIKGLAQQHELTLLTFSSDDQPFGPLADLCTEIVTVPLPNRSPALRLWQMLSSPLPDMAWRLHSLNFNFALHDLLQQSSYDIVQIEGIELAPAIAIVREEQPAARLVYDAHNAEAELQHSAYRTARQRPARWPAALYSTIQTRRLRRFERQTLAAVDAAVTVSEQDRQLLPQTQTPVAVIPNCIDVDHYRRWRGQTQPFDVIFTGKMDYRPNVDAILWFAAAIWPLVRRQLPHATLAIVGQRPHARLTKLDSHSGITITGFVDQIEPYLHGAKLFVMPLRIGSGTRLKLLEAMAADLPLVSTTLGAAGYPLTDDVELLLRDDAEAFATAVIDLLSDPQQAQRLAANAGRFVADYDWERVIPQFNLVYDQITAAARKI